MIFVAFWVMFYFWPYCLVPFGDDFLFFLGFWKANPRKRLRFAFRETTLLTGSFLIAVLCNLLKRPIVTRKYQSCSTLRLLSSTKKSRYGHLERFNENCGD